MIQTGKSLKSIIDSYVVSRNGDPMHQALHDEIMGTFFRENDNTCIFCGAATMFSDSGKFYCIDCYCKLRDTAHTHGAPWTLPQPLTITPHPTKPYEPPTIIC